VATGAGSPDDAGFDRFRETYAHELNRAVAFAGRDADVYTAIKADVLVELACRAIGDPRRLTALDVGCGIGLTDGHLADRFSALAGVDISPAMVERAADSNPRVDYRVADGTRLPFDDASFDLTFTICVLHHVRPERRVAFVREMSRVTRPGGVVAIAEHNPLNPLTRYVVSRCTFDEDAVLLGQRESKRLLASGGLEPLKTRNILFLPSTGRVARAVQRVLRPVPFGAQYVAAGRRAE